MEKTQTLQQIRAALMDRARAMRELSNQAFHIENQIAGIAGQLYAIEAAGNPGGGETVIGEKKSNIIPFPAAGMGGFRWKAPRSINRPVFSENPGYLSSTPFGWIVPILARSGEALPRTIPDFRPSLQRDGLILLSWAKKHTEMGERFAAYWVTSRGIYRYYASKDLDAEHFASAVPVQKSYAAEDGIDFHGQNTPAYIVHVAPDLMMGKRQAGDQRPEHIKKLQALGMNADYNYPFLLTQEKKKKRSLRRREEMYPQKNHA